MAGEGVVAVVASSCNTQVVQRRVVQAAKLELKRAAGLVAKATEAAVVAVETTSLVHGAAAERMASSMLSGHLR